MGETVDQESIKLVIKIKSHCRNEFECVDCALRIRLVLGRLLRLDSAGGLGVAVMVMVVLVEGTLGLLEQLLDSLGSGGVRVGRRDVVHHFEVSCLD